MLEWSDAQHAEYDAAAAQPLIAPVSCPVPDRAAGAPKLWGALKIRLRRDSLAYRAIGRAEIEEQFNCNFELNPAMEPKFAGRGMEISGRGANGEARIVEIPANRFFIATAFLPQLVSTGDRPHPLITAFVGEAMAFNLNFPAARRASL